MQQHVSKFSDDELTTVKEDAGSLSLKYLYQSDNNMNNDLAYSWEDLGFLLLYL